MKFQGELQLGINGRNKIFLIPAVNSVGMVNSAKSVSLDTVHITKESVGGVLFRFPVVEGVDENA